MPALSCHNTIAKKSNIVHVVKIVLGILISLLSVAGISTSVEYFGMHL
jgi:hypothetical protein